MLATLETDSAGRRILSHKHIKNSQGFLKNFVCGCDRFRVGRALCELHRPPVWTSWSLLVVRASERKTEFGLCRIPVSLVTHRLYHARHIARSMACALGGACGVGCRGDPGFKSRLATRYGEADLS